MPDFSEYDHTETVEAYQIDAEDAGSVVTSQGLVQAREGDYVVKSSDGTVSVQERDSFEEYYGVHSTNPDRETVAEQNKPQR